MLNSKFVCYSLKELDVLSQIAYAKKISSFLVSLNFEYPGFNKWYWSLFENSRLKNDRNIIFYVNGTNIVGVAILKQNKEEKKICTLRVAPMYQNLGIGSALIERSFELLDCEKPLITIHVSKYRSFKHIFDKYGFELEQQITGYYGLFKSELSYNGVLDCNVTDSHSELENIIFGLERLYYGFPIENKAFWSLSTNLI